MERTIIALFLGLVLLAGCTSPQTESGDVNVSEGAGEEQSVNESYVDVSPEEARELIENTPALVVIDVSPHYDDGHLPGAVHHYLGDGSLDAAIPSLDKSRPYLVYCHVDSVAIQGAERLVDAGFSPVYRLEGNYGAWVAAGYPVEK